MSQCLLHGTKKENITLEKTIEYMTLNPDHTQGWALYWCENKTKYILRDITYQEALSVDADYIAVRFFPYGYLPGHDVDVLNNATGLETLKLN